MADKSVMDGFNDGTGPKKESIVNQVFKGAAGGFSSAMLGLGTASVDGTKLIYKLMVEGKDISTALAESTATRDTFRGLNQMTGLPFTREQAGEQLGPAAGAAFEIGQAFAPTRGATKGGAIARTAGNTGINLGIEGVGDIAGEGAAIALSLVPGFSTRTAREVLASQYANKLTPQQIERIKNGTITLAEITNDPKLMATQRRLQMDPNTAGRFQEFDRNAANAVETRLQTATPRAATQTGNTPPGLVSSVYKAYEKQTASLKAAKETLADRDFGRVAANINPDQGIIDAQPIVARIDREIAEHRALNQTDDVRATIAGLERMRTSFFEQFGELQRPPLVDERRTLLDARINELRAVQMENPTTARSLQINRLEQELLRLDESGEPQMRLRPISVNELRSQLSQWSGKMHSGDGLFDGVSPTQAKRIARNIFAAYGDAITDTAKNASDPNVRDAMVALDRARKNYRNSLDRIDAFQERELSKYFGSVDNVASLTSKPDAVLDKLANLSPNERNVAFNIIRNQLPDGQAVIQQLQGRQWEKMIEKAQIKGGSDTTPRFDVNKFLTEMDKADERLLIEMIPDLEQRKAVRDTIAEMRIMARRNDWNMTEKPARPGTESVGALAQATNTRTIVASGILNIMNDIKNGIIGPDRLLNMMLNPSFKGNTVGERLTNFTRQVTNVADPSLADLTRAMRPLADELAKEPQLPRPEDDTGLPTPPEGFFEQDLPAPPPGFFNENTPTPNAGASEQQSMKVQPQTQAARDDIRKQILMDELAKETDPAAKASIQRELERMK